MNHYADSSFLVSFYLLDTNSRAANQAVRHVGHPFPVTDFGAFELRNAIHGMVFRRTVIGSVAEAALRKVERDISTEFLKPVTVRWDEVVLRAEALSRRHTQILGSRALDVLHVASALVLGCTDFLTFDTRQAQLARDAGLRTPV